MRMKLLAMMSVILVAAVFASGCVSVSYPVAHDKSFPPDGRYEVIGSVLCKDRTIIIFGLIWLGGVKYINLGAEAEKKYNVKVNDVVNVSVDHEVMSVLGIYTQVETTMRGTAIRYIDAPAAE